MSNNTMYSKIVYIAKETRKPTYLDFFEIEEKHLKMLVCYDKETIRYNGKWFFVISKELIFYSKENRDKQPNNLIQYLYKKPKPII